MNKSFALLALLSSCATYTVIRQADPNPFPQSDCKVAIAPVSFDGVRVGNIMESEWLARKPAEETASYNTDKQTMATLFVGAVTGSNAPYAAAGTSGPYVAKAKLTMWEPGFFSAFVNKDSEASMVVEIVDDKGAVVDEVTFTTRVQSSIYNPSTGGRMHTAGKQLGRIFSSYLSTRLTCGKK